jgi:hypothetical protein
LQLKIALISIPQSRVACFAAARGENAGREYMRESNSKAIRNSKPSNGTKPTRVYKPGGRSKITNGVRLLPNVDGRTFWVRRFRDVRALHLSDLGGEDNCSEAEKSIARRAALLTVELERLETVFAEASEATPQQLALYGTTSNTLRRLLESIGIGRRSRDVTPSFGNLLAADAAMRQREQSVRNEEKRREWEERQAAQERGVNAD